MSKTYKLVAGVVGLATAFTMVVGAGTASAAEISAAQLAAILAGLGLSQAQITAITAALPTSTTSTVATGGYTFTKDLQVGSRGDDVTALQQALGIAPTTGYFGPLTKAAVVKFQKDNGINGTGYVGPLTRAALNKLASTTTTTTTTTTVPMTGAVTVTTGAPVANTVVVQGQAAAPLANFVMSNGSTGPVSVTKVVLNRTGVSADDTLSNVYLFDGNTRLSDSATVSNGVITFAASNGLFTIGSASTRTITVRADIVSVATGGSRAGQLVGVSLASVVANGSVSGSFPIAGATMSIATPTNLGSVTFSTTLPASNNVNAGTQNYTIWSNQLSVSNRALNLSHIGYTIVGSIATDALQNIGLFVNGNKVATGVVSSDLMINFDMATPVVLNTGNSTVEVRADVVKGSSRNFTVKIQNAADFIAVDSNYNVGVTPGTNYNSSTGTITIGQGSLTISTDPSFSATTVTGNASNVVLARYTLKAYGEDMKVSYLTASVSTSTDNLALFANGAQIASSQNYTGTAISFSIGSSLIVPAGQAVTLEVRGDTKINGNATANGTSIAGTIKLVAGNAQGQESKYTYPASDMTVVGPTLTINNGTLTVSQNSGSGINAGSVNNLSNVKIGSFVLQTGSAEAVNVSNLAIGMSGTVANTDLTNLYVKYGSTQLNPLSQAQASNNFSVSGLKLSTNSNITVDVYADVSNTATGTIKTTLTVTAQGDATTANLSSSAVTGQTITLSTGALAVPTLTSASRTAQLVLGGSTVDLATWNFVSTTSPATIIDMHFSVSGVIATSITSVTVAGKNFTVVGGAATTTDLNIPVSVGYAGQNVPVTVTYNAVGLGGVSSNATSTLTLDYYKYKVGNGTPVEVVTSKASNPMTLVASKPTMTLNASSNASLNNGNTELARITVAADSKGKISITAIPLSVATGTASVASYTAEENGTVIAGATATATGIAFATPFEVSAGSSRTISLKGVVSGAVTDASVSVSLGSAGSLGWIDVEGANAAITGIPAYGYPTNSVTLKY